MQVGDILECCWAFIGKEAFLSQMVEEQMKRCMSLNSILHYFMAAYLSL